MIDRGYTRAWSQLRQRCNPTLRIRLVIRLDEIIVMVSSCIISSLSSILFFVLKWSEGSIPEDFTGGITPA